MKLKKLGVEVDCSPSKLKTGWGEGVCLLLNKLLDKTLKAQKFKFRNAKFDKKDNTQD